MIKIVKPKKSLQNVSKGGRRGEHKKVDMANRGAAV